MTRWYFIYSANPIAPVIFSEDTKITKGNIMSKKKQILKPDIVLKNYWNNNDQFSDLFNAVLFGGEQLIKAEELEDMDTEEFSIMGISLGMGRFPFTIYFRFRKR